MQEFMVPPRILTGEGAAAALGDEAAALGATRCVLVTDPVLRDRTKTVSDAEGSLRRAGVRVDTFADVEPDPMIATAIRCADFARPLRPDLLVGLGGGSSLDVAKAAAAILGNDVALAQMWGVRNVPRPAVPLILLPTTSGTGSEVTPNSILTDVKPDGSHMKKGIVSPHILARTAIVDPLLTVTAPPGITASTGMDALTHAIESYVSLSAQPLTLPLSLEAVRLIGRSLRRAVADGHDLDARREMASASLLAGLAFANGFLGGVHAIAMAMGGQHDVPHGVANALLLPYVMAFNEPAAPAQYARIARALGEPVEDLPETEAAHRATRAVHRLAADIALPRTLGDVKITRSAIPRLAEEAFGNQRLLRNNPRPATVADLTAILEHAASGPAE